MVPIRHDKVEDASLGDSQLILHVCYTGDCHLHGSQEDLGELPPVRGLLGEEGDE